MDHPRLHSVILLVTTVAAGSHLSSCAGETQNAWHDPFFQYRIPLVVDVEQSGWTTVPISAFEITSAVNRLEEMHYDPLWFAYNHLKVVEVDSQGRVIDPEPVAGFYLIPESEELIDPGLLGSKETIEIEVEEGAFYLLSYSSQGGGRSPGYRYDPIWPLGHERRKNAYQASYEPKMLPRQLTRHERLFLTDSTPMQLDIQSRWVTGVKEISLQKVQIRFLARLQTEGRKNWMLYYQPFNGHHLMVPQRRHPERAASWAKIVRLGQAQKYTGSTQYVLASDDHLTAWFAETTVKLTPQTPLPSESSPALKISSAANEAQSFQVVLNPRKSFHFKSIRATSLRFGEYSIPSTNISFYAVEYVPISRPSNITPVKYLGPVGDPLLSVSPTELSPNAGNYVLWATVKTPAGTPAGTYRGHLAIDGEGRSSMRIPLELQVYDFQLPEYSTFTTAFGGSHITQSTPPKKTQVDYHHLSSKEDIKRLARKYYDLMAENKMTPHSAVQYTAIGMNWTPPPAGYKVDRPGNFFKLQDWDFSEWNSALRHYIDDLKVNAFTLVHTNPSVVYRFKHLPGKELKEYNRQAPHIALAWQAFRQATFVGINKKETDQSWGGPPPNQVIEISQKQYDRLLLDFYATIARNLEKHGWLDYAYILVDETHYRGFGEFLHFLRLLKSNPLTARIKVAWTIQSSPAFDYRENPEDENYAFNGLIDIYIPEAQENYQWWEKYYFTDYDIEPTRQKLWTYVTSTARVTIDSPGINNRAFALEVFNYGGSGYLCWASFMWDSVGCETDNPWEHPWTRWGNGAMSYFYPPRKDGPAPEPDWTIVPSLRLMTYREGVDDYEYARILEDLVARAQVKGIDASPAKSLLNEIPRFFYNSVHWSQNDAWYLDLRHQMAQAIVELKKAINNK